MEPRHSTETLSPASFCWLSVSTKAEPARRAICLCRSRGSWGDLCPGQEPRSPWCQGRPKTRRGRGRSCPGQLRSFAASGYARETSEAWAGAPLNHEGTPLPQSASFVFCGATRSRGGERGSWGICPNYHLGCVCRAKQGDCRRILAAMAESQGGTARENHNDLSPHVGCCSAK